MLDPADALGLEADAVAIYTRAEDYLIRVIRNAILRVGESPAWAEAQLLAIRQERGNIMGMAQALQNRSPELWRSTIDQAYVRGMIAAEVELAQLPEIAVTGSLVSANPTGVLAIASEGVGLMNTVHRNLLRATEDIWRRIVQEAVGMSTTGAMTTFEGAQRAFTRMSRDGLGFFVDSAGRRWGLDTYAEMAVRTGTNKALRAGHTNTMIEHGVDLVIVSSHPNPAPQCAPYERQVLSLAGMHSPGTHRIGDNIVQVAATMAEAEANGLHHPNAILGGDQAIDTFAGAVGASKATYRGPAITIRTAKGHRATVSPEHPILTDRGWRTAESLSVGDNLFNPVETKGSSSGILLQPNFNDVPTTVENEFVSLKNRGMVISTPSTGHNFNDDRQFIEGEIDVVVTDDCLLPVPDTHVVKETGEVNFMWPDMGRRSEIGDRPHSQGFGSVRDSLPVFGSLPDGGASGGKAATNGGVRRAEKWRDILATHSGLVEGANLSDVDGLATAVFRRKTGTFERQAYTRVGDSQSPADVGTAVPGGIEADYVVNVERFTFHGDAYDFQTVDGVYALNGIMSHNCRHRHSVYVPGYTDNTPPDIDPNHEGYKATQKQRYYERQIRASKRMELAAINDTDAANARSRARAYQAKLREHVKDHDLPRRRHREQVRRVSKGPVGENY